MKRRSSDIAEGDLTPMIDMVFQLIAFFMVLVNFSDTEAAQDVTLPASELAKPPEGKIEDVVYLHMTPEGSVILHGEALTKDELPDALRQEIEERRREDDVNADDITVIVRADEDAKAGDVQELVQDCMELGLINFRMRAKEERPTLSTG